MWNNRSGLLLVHVRGRQERRRFGITLPLALFVPGQWLLAWQGLLELVPGAAGLKARLVADLVYGVLTQLIYAEPQNIVDAKLEGGQQKLRVLVRTCGLKGGGAQCS